jgi:general secretion pathway protein G
VSSSPRKKRQGFTLVELLVVIMIIATLAAVVAPSVLQNVGSAKAAAASAQIEGYALALGAYRLDTDEYPTTSQGLEALRTPPAGETATRFWRGPYLSKIVPDDPWGRPYVYVSPGPVNSQSYDLYTLGRDGRPGGSGDDADVTSWGGPVTP